MTLAVTRYHSTRASKLFLAHRPVRALRSNACANLSRSRGRSADQMRRLGCRTATRGVCAGSLIPRVPRAFAENEAKAPRGDRRGKRARVGPLSRSANNNVRRPLLESFFSVSSLRCATCLKRRGDLPKVLAVEPNVKRR